MPDKGIGMIQQYLQAMIDGLKKKEDILDVLTDLTKKQQEIVSADSPDWDAFDKTVDEKSTLIEELDKLDVGFSAVFDRIKNQIEPDREEYKEYIRTLQDRIRIVTDKSNSLMALEERTRVKVTEGFKMQRQTIKQQKVSSKAVTNYYNSMNRMNFVDPQLMDQKK